MTPDRQVWSVLWPDGITRQHAVGANNRFDLVHLNLHRLAGAPVTRSHFKLLLGAKVRSEAGTSRADGGISWACSRDAA